MKKIDKILKVNPDIPVIRQLYGQNLENVLEQISLICKPEIFLILQKKFGFNSFIKYFKAHNIKYQVVGKGSPDLRMLKLDPSQIQPHSSESLVTLEINGKKIELQTNNSIFSRNHIDKGSQILIDYLQSKNIDIKGTVLDIGTGYGTISAYLLNSYSKIQVLGYEIDPISMQNCTLNLKKHSNFKVILGDFLQADLSEQIDYVVANPPLHITHDERESLFAKLYENNPNLKFIMVIKSRFISRFKASALKHFPSTNAIEKDNYFLLNNLTSSVD